jgi:hypothetical protein
MAQVKMRPTKGPRTAFLPTAVRRPGQLSSKLSVSTIGNQTTQSREANPSIKPHIINRIPFSCGNVLFLYKIVAFLSVGGEHIVLGSCDVNLKSISCSHHL